MATSFRVDLEGAFYASDLYNFLYDGPHEHRPALLAAWACHGGCAGPLTEHARWVRGLFNRKQGSGCTRAQKTGWGGGEGGEHRMGPPAPHNTRQTVVW